MKKGGRVLSQFAPFVFIAVVLQLATVAFGQETRATVLGRVTDTTGGIVPGADIVARNVETNVTVRALSNDSGLYEIPFLHPGVYEITAAQPGFKTYIRQGVRLSINSRVDIDIILEVGEVHESVIVLAESPLLETGNASLAQVMDNRRVMELPLVGNSVIMLSGLAYGMQRTAGYNYHGLHSNAGASSHQTAGGVGGNEWVLDGTPITGISRRAAYLPYTDTVDEVRVESTNFDSKVGHSTGAYITMQTKAGTNDYHGTMTWSHWQQRWNATPSNDNAVYWGPIGAAETQGDSERARRLRGQPRQPSGRSNNWAASVGGPIQIPRLFDGTDKLFFFFGYNAYKDRKGERAENRLFTVPTAEERQGDFSRLLSVDPVKYQIYDPLTARLDPQSGLFVRSPFPNNRIPQNRIVNPMYKFYEKFYPMPNNPPQADAEGNFNYFNARIPFNWDYYAVQNRLDYIHSQRNRLFFRWSYSKFVEDRNDWTFETARFLHSGGLHRINKGSTLDWVHTFNSTSILNVAVAYNRYIDNQLKPAQYKFKPSDVGLPNYLDEKAGEFHTLPTVNFTDYRQVSNAVEKLLPTSVGTLKSDFSKYLGKHSLSVGWDGRIYSRIGGIPGFTSGRFEFRNNLLRRTSAATGVGTLGIEWAAFMLGIPNSMTVENNDTFYITTPYQAVYLQDNYRVTPQLTLNLGLRMEYEGSIRERFDRGLRDFDVNAQVSIAAAAQQAYAASPLTERPASDFIVRGGVNYLGVGGPRTRTEPTYRWMPRFGFAYHMRPKMVIRGGFGLYHDTLNVSHTTVNQTGYSRTTSTIITNDNGVTWKVGNPAAGIPPTADPFPLRPDGIRFDSPIGNTIGRNTFLGQAFTFINPNFEPARQQRWRLEIEQLINKDSVVAIAYTGSWVDNFGVPINLNALPEKYWASGLVRNTAISNDLQRSVSNPFFLGKLTGLQQQDPALYRYLSTISFFTSPTVAKHQLLRPFPHMGALVMSDVPIGKNSYHALQVRFDKRFSAGWTFNTHYEWSHTMSKNFVANEFDREPTWRESNASRPHRWVATGIWEFPFGERRQFLSAPGVLRSLFGGWQVAAIWQMQSGSAIDFGNVFYYGDDLRDIVLPASERGKERWFNTSNFERSSSRIPAAFHKRVFPGNMNWLRTATLKQLDANIQKTVRLGESWRALFRVDMINAPNHQVMNVPNVTPTSASFGRITTYINEARLIQFQMRLTF